MCVYTHLYVETHVCVCPKRCVCTQTDVHLGLFQKGQIVLCWSKSKSGHSVLERSAMCRGQPPPLLAGQLAVKAGEADGKGLKSAERVVVVQRELILGHTPKLHDDVRSWKHKGTRV